MGFFSSQSGDQVQIYHMDCLVIEQTEVNQFIPMVPKHVHFMTPEDIDNSS